MGGGAGNGIGIVITLGEEFGMGLGLMLMPGTRIGNQVVVGLRTGVWAGDEWVVSRSAVSVRVDIWLRIKLGKGGNQVFCSLTNVYPS